MDTLHLTKDLRVGYIGPPLEKGPLPSVFYFALSARESLANDPYNQPAVYLAKRGVRVFSMDLPAHGAGLNPLDAIGAWATEFSIGGDPLRPFVERAVEVILELLARGIILEEKIGIMGLSRGGLIGSLVAARYQKVCASVHFAPLTQLTMAKEFETLRDHPAVKAHNLENHVVALCRETIRIYIGNRDVRVGTDRCFRLVETLANAAFEHNLRSPPIELIVSPSIGNMGHGTGKETFEAGANWLAMKLGVA